MPLPRFLIPSLVMLAVTCVCASTAEAGGLLHRLFGRQSCRPVTTCRPMMTCRPAPSPCVAAAQPPCGCGPAVEVATVSVPPDCVPCMRGNGVSNGNPELCADQRERDEKCCERHADDPETYDACMKLAELRELACQRRMPFKVRCPRETSAVTKSGECDCSYCGSDYGCQYTCNYQCWLEEYCATCDPMMGHNCSPCEKMGGTKPQK